MIISKQPKNNIYIKINKYYENTGAVKILYCICCILLYLINSVLSLCVIYNLTHLSIRRFG